MSAKRLGTWMSAVVVTLYQIFIFPLPLGYAQERKVEVSKDVVVAVPPNWSRSEVKYRNAVQLVYPRVEGQTRGGVDAVMTITSEPRRNHEEAVQRLAEIAVEIEPPVEFIEIGGWPALQRQYTAPLERTGQEEKQEKAPLPPRQLTLRVTTAIAVEDTVIQFQTVLSPAAGPTVAEQAKGMVRRAVVAKKANPGRTQRDLNFLRERRLKPVAPSSPQTAPRPGATPGKVPSASYLRPGTKPPEKVVGVAHTVQTGSGELEVAASADGQTVVVAANGGYSNSIDGGQNFTFRGGTPGAFPRDGDPTLAVGASGAFYYGFIGFPNGTTAALGVSGCSNSIGRSTDNAVTFPIVGHAVLCPQTGAICLPDQPHIAADRVNSAGGSDQVYNVWRNFTPAGMPPPTCNGIGGGFVNAALVCSSNNAGTWTAPALMPGGSDFPRVAVGPDGFVYVVYRSGGNVMLNKFSSCASGLTQQVGFPQAVGTFTDVTCPVAGLDRCNDGNVLSSPTVAVDSTNANHVYVAFASNTASGNENIVVKDSVDGGATWPRSQVVNSSVTGRRFMPWVCALGGTAFVFLV